ncbi:putative inactive histone-lysine N-methyltransferase SUVR2 [Forsythia ovata]|uniref:Inactive histone-lysine N-methyltransferase SUVR2 n=1 Tax=Forsythia ovata TaxID=205694 RepID=A0ABD1PHY7_9LAMI
MAPNPKAVKACKTLKGMGYSEKVVKPVLKNLLKLYENNWEFIEDENYRVLIDAIIESEENKVARVKRVQQNALSESEPEESEPPLKRSKSNSQTDQRAPSCHDSVTNHSTTIGKMKNKGENQAHGKKNMAESSNKLLLDEDIKPKVLSPKYHQDEGKNQSSPLSHRGLEQTKEIQLLSDDENDEFKSLALRRDSGDESISSLIFSEKRTITYERFNQSNSYKELCNAVIESVPFTDSLPNYKVPLSVDPPDPPRLLLEGGSCGSCSNSKENCSTFPELMDLDAEEKCELLYLCVPPLR